MKIKKAIIPAAGLGTRVLPASKALPKEMLPIVRQHHERYNGSGYPDGLIGDEISLGARITAVADCFDAMTARRPYKQPMSVSYAISELEKNSGTQFDPELVPVFVKLIYEGKISV